MQRVRTDPFTRLMKHVRVVGECWLWSGKLQKRGSGFVAYFNMGDGRIELAHRASYELFYGTIAPGENILHSCDIGYCLNPEHLSEGSQAENVRQCVERGRDRYALGVDNARAKLTDEEVKVIRYSEESSRTLGKRFDVSHSTILQVKNRQNWKHIE